MDEVFYLVSLVGEVFFFKNYHFDTGFRGRVEFFLFAAFDSGFFTPQVSEVFFFFSLNSGWFFFQKSSMPPPISNGAPLTWYISINKVDGTDIRERIMESPQNHSSTSLIIMQWCFTSQTIYFSTCKISTFQLSKKSNKAALIWGSFKLFV